LLELLKGPYVSGVQSPQLWSALIADEGLVRSRLHELFLDLVIDPVDEFAFTRKIVTDEIEAPAAVRSERLTFLDTAMLLVLRQLLLPLPGRSASSSTARRSMSGWRSTAPATSRRSSATSTAPGPGWATGCASSTRPLRTASRSHRCASSSSTRPGCANRRTSTSPRPQA